MTRSKSPRALKAGEAALKRGAWADALGSFQSALAREESPEALEGIGWAQWWMDHPLESFAARERAYRLYQKRGDRRAGARIALTMTVDSFDFHGEPSVARGWADRARRLLVGLEDSPEYGWAVLWEGHWARTVDRNIRHARQQGARAAALGRKLGLLDLEMLGRALQALTLIDSGRVADGMRQLDEAMTTALSGDMMALEAVGQTCCFLMHACDRVGDYDRAVQWCSRIKSFCEEWNVKTLFKICRTHYASILISKGDWTEAERELRAACAQEDSRPYVTRRAWVQLAELRRRQGRIEEARALFERAEGHPLALLGRAAIALDNRRYEEAADLADRFLHAVSGDIPMEVATALDLRVHALVPLDQVADAERACADLRRLVRTLKIPPMRALALSADAALARTAGDHDAARRGYRKAADLFTAARMPYEAKQALARAEAGASASRSGNGQGPVPESLPGLTSREREVLRLVAQGLSDRVMASRLRLSEHTVHRHVANILTKLDVPSRSAAVAHAVRAALI